MAVRDEGFMSVDGKEIYYLCIIDILQLYDLNKKAERFWKVRVMHKDFVRPHPTLLPHPQRACVQWHTNRAVVAAAWSVGAAATTISGSVRGVRVRPGHLARRHQRISHHQHTTAPPPHRALSAAHSFTR
jgi:hypothetical protein